jgi:hypothetical protein
MGRVLKSQSIDVRNSTNTPFNNTNLAWKKGKNVLGWYHKEHDTLIFLDPLNFEKS